MLILLAEDESSLGLIIKESLENRNFTVTLCENGEIALNTFKKNIFDRMLGKLGNFYLRNELYDLDKDIKWSVPGDNSFSPLGKQGVDNGLQAALGHVVRFAFDPENIVIRFLLF